MNKIVIIVFTFFSVTTWSQSATKEVLRDVLLFNTETAIASNLDSVHVDKFLSKLTIDKQLKFTEKNKYYRDSITLTEEERLFLITSFRKQYHKPWKQDDFPNFRVIAPEDIKNYRLEKVRNRIVTVSDPVLFRKKEWALLFFASSVRSSGHTEVVFCRKINGIWKRAVWITAEYY